MADGFVNIEGFEIPSLSGQESLLRVLQHPQGSLVAIAWLNAHCANVARGDVAYREALSGFDLLYNDGIGLQLAARLQGTRFHENLNGTDWIPEFLTLLETRVERPRTLFLLGASPASLAAAAAAIGQRWPGLSVVGMQDGYFDDEERVTTGIAKLRPEVLLVAMGVPRQELFIHRHRAALEEAGVRIAIAGGAILDFIGGTVPRAPGWVRRVKAEWVWRLGLEPSRLWRRYVIGNPLFLFHAYRHGRQSRR